MDDKNKLDTELDNIKKEIHTKSNRLKKINSRLDTSLVMLAEKTNELKELDIKIKNAKNYIKEINSKIQEKKKNITLNDVMSKKEDILEKKQEEMNKIYSKIIKKITVVKEKEEELLQKEALLYKKMEELEEYKKQRDSSVITPSEQEYNLMIKYRKDLVDAISKYGSIASALKKCAVLRSSGITTGSVLYFKNKIQSLQQDIDFALEIYREDTSTTFEEALEDRALEGTDTPMFDKNGNFIGDYKIKNDKLLLEVAKIKNKKFDTKVSNVKEEKQHNTVNIQINNFEDMYKDEIKHQRNIGIVKSIDESGNMIKEEKRYLIENKDNTFEDTVIDCDYSKLEDLLDE